ncbi:MAG TPA: hypothetical protein VFS43_38425 [Polyangiaceae bacterium]|nr:hypothetical protein [Polyangiaceae bacterium]
MRRAAEFLLGGAVVYVAMAAQAAGCASEVGPDVGPLGSGGQGGALVAGGFGGAPGGPSGEAGAVATAGEGGSGGIFNPVPAADAKSGTRLKARAYRGADGSEQPTFTWQDTERNEECSFRVAADGKVRCLPSAAVSASYFADAGCTIPAYFTATPIGCVPPPAYLFANAETCSPDGAAGVRVFERGAPPISIYGGKPGACVVLYATIPGGFVVYGAGAEVPASAFVEASIATLP